MFIFAYNLIFAFSPKIKLISQLNEEREREKKSDKNDDALRSYDICMEIRFVSVKQRKKFIRLNIWALYE